MERLKPGSAQGATAGQPKINGAIINVDEAFFTMIPPEKFSQRDVITQSPSLSVTMPGSDTPEPEVVEV